METKCWAYGDTEDCAWVYFGYGSRWDMIGPNYKKGLFLSLRALKMFLYYDYELKDMRSPDEEKIKELGIDFLPDTCSYNEYDEKTYYYFTGKYWDCLTPKQKMCLSAIHIDHPNAEEWFEKVEKYSGKFMREHPDFKEEMKNVVCPEGEKYYSKVPSEEEIMNIDLASGLAIERVWEKDKEAMEEDGNYSSWYGTLTKEQFDAWQEESEKAMQEFMDQE